MDTTRLLTVLATAFAVGAVAYGARAEPGLEYRLVKSVPLGAPDRWDFVTYDAASQRVYVAHGDRVSVVDGRSGAPAGQVTGIAGGTHGIAISPATATGYTDDGEAGAAISFDLATLKIRRTTATDADADDVVFDPASGHVFVVAGDPGKVSVIDPQTEKVVATIDGGGKLEIAVADGTGKFYVNGEAKKEIVRVDTRTNRVDARWPIPGCTSPHGLAIDTRAGRLFASCKNAVLVVVDTATGKVVATVPIGKGSDGAAFDPERRLVFSSNGLDGTISVIRQTDPDTYVAAAPIRTAVSGRTMAIDPRTGRLYVAAADVESAPAAGQRVKLRPGTLKLLFLDPAR